MINSKVVVKLTSKFTSFYFMTFYSFHVKAKWQNGFESNSSTKQQKSWTITSNDHHYDLISFFLLFFLIEVFFGITTMAANTLEQNSDLNNQDLKTQIMVLIGKLIRTKEPELTEPSDGTEREKLKVICLISVVSFYYCIIFAFLFLILIYSNVLIPLHTLLFIHFDWIHFRDVLKLVI